MAMSIPHSDRWADVASDTGAFVQKAAGAAAPSGSMVGRVVDTAAAAKVGARLIPAAWRMIKRYPLGTSLIIIGLVAAASLLPRGTLTRHKPVT
jgi:hypothetical protein